MLHFGLLLIYANPFAGTKGKYGYLAQWYAYPYFHQRWDVFVPPPDANYRLYVKNETMNYDQDLFKNVISKQKDNLFGVYEPISAVFANSIFVFEKSAGLLSATNGAVVNDLNFKIIEHASENYLRAAYKKEVGKMKLILVVEEPFTKKRRVYYN